MRNLRKEAESFVRITCNDIVSPSKEKEWRAVDRYEKCLACEVLSDSKQRCSGTKEGKAVKSFIYKNQEINKGDSRSGCNCPLSSKIREESICPLGKW